MKEEQSPYLATGTRTDDMGTGGSLGERERCSVQFCVGWQEMHCYPSKIFSCWRLRSIVYCSVSTTCRMSTAWHSFADGICACIWYIGSYSRDLLLCHQISQMVVLGGREPLPPPLPPHRKKQFEDGVCGEVVKRSPCRRGQGRYVLSPRKQ